MRASPGCAPRSRRNPERARRFDCREAGITRALTKPDFATQAGFSPRKTLVTLLKSSVRPKTLGGTLVSHHFLGRLHVSYSGVSRFFIFARTLPPFAAGVGPQFPSQVLLLRRSIGPPISFSPIVTRNQASGRGSSCSVSSLKFALPRREQAAAFSHSPRQDVWLQTERLLRLQTFVPHSQDSRLPSPENA